MDSPSGAGRAFRHRVDYEGRSPALRLPLRRSRWAPLATLAAAGLAAQHMWQWRGDAAHWRWGAVPLLIEAAALVLILCGMLSQIFCSETLRVFDGHLEIGMGVGPIVRTWRYRADRICELHADEEGDAHKGHGRIFTQRPGHGAVAFRYAGKTIHAAPGAGREEGEAIVAWLAQRLPRSAVELE